MKVALKLAPIFAHVFLHAITTALVGSAAVGLTLNKYQAFEFALAATVANLVSLISTCWAVFNFVWRPVDSLYNTLRARKGTWGLIVAPAIAFVITSVFLLMITFQDQTAKGDGSLLGPSIHQLVVATWVFFVISFIANIVLLVFCYLSKPSRYGQTTSEAGDPLGQNSLNRNQSPPPPFNGNGIAISARSPYNLSTAGSSVFSEAYEFQTLTPDGIRSVSSRTRLIESRSASDVANPQPRSHNEISKPPATAVSKTKTASYIASGRQPNPMETIPGSASNSPDKSLGWPFNERQTEGQRRNSVRVRESTTSPPTRQPKEPEVEREGPSQTRQPRDLSIVTTPSRARVLDESHIHPLFRSDSPDPPPVPSPTTCVVASALGGKYVTGNELGRIRSTSNPSAAASIPLSAFGGSRAGSKNSPSDKNSLAPGDSPVARSKSFQASTSEKDNNNNNN